jgi:hypothetical protein
MYFLPLAKYVTRVIADCTEQSTYLMAAQPAKELPTF